jgi:hypothetical protein
MAAENNGGAVGWPVSIRAIAMSAKSGDLRRVFVSWTLASAVHRTWFEVGDWSVLEIFVLCAASKCPIPSIRDIVQRRALEVRLSDLPEEKAIALKLAPDRRKAAPLQCQCQKCLGTDLHRAIQMSAQAK